MKDKLEILFWRFARYLISKGYNECDEFERRCASCRAWKARHWIDEHIALLQWNVKNP